MPDVCDPADFVGRRAALDRCVRVLKAPLDSPQSKIGVVIHGFRGFGKSSLAWKIADVLVSAGYFSRWPAFHGRVDEVGFLRTLYDGLDPKDVSGLEGLTMDRALRKLFEGSLRENPQLFLFDDWEQNLEDWNRPISAESFTQPRVAEKPAALVTELTRALRDTGNASRILFTTRRLFQAEAIEQLHLESLLPMRLDELSSAVEAEDMDRLMRLRLSEHSGGNPELAKRLRSAGSQEWISVIRDFARDAEVEEVIRQASPELLDFIRRLSVCQIDMSQEAVKRIAQVEAPERLIKWCVSNGLLCSSPSRPDAPVFIVPSFVQWLVDLDAADRVEAAGRALSFFLSDSDTHSRSLDDHAEMVRLAQISQQPEVAKELIRARRIPESEQFTRRVEPRSDWLEVTTEIFSRLTS